MGARSYSATFKEWIYFATFWLFRNQQPSFFNGLKHNYFHFVFDILPRLLVYIDEVDPLVPILIDDYVFAKSNTFQLQWLRLFKREGLNFIKVDKNILSAFEKVKIQDKINDIILYADEITYNKNDNLKGCVLRKMQYM